jgi:hypothetical protein
VGDAGKSHEQQREEARQALESLIKIMARATVDACYKLGIDFDMDDPEVAQEVMKATFEGLFYPTSAPAARSKSSNQACYCDVKIRGSPTPFQKRCKRIPASFPANLPVQQNKNLARIIPCQPIAATIMICGPAAPAGAGLRSTLIA